MDKIWALTPGSGDTGLALRLEAEWKKPDGNPDKLKLSKDDIERMWVHLDFLRTARVRVMMAADIDIRKSALLATEEVDRILYREQEVWGTTIAKYTLTPNNLTSEISGGSAGLAFALAFATTVYRINHKQHFRDIAATGTINKYGYVGEIGLLDQKIPLALEKFTDSGGYILYPQENECDVTQTLREAAKAKDVELKPVKHLFDALTAIGIELNNINLNPFQGLDAYKYEDAAVFFGRDKEAQAIIDRLQERAAKDGQGIVLVCGASGSGKSSLIQAGVMPRLDRALTKVEKYRWSVVRPRELGQAPLWDTLAAACCTDKGVGKPPPIKPVVHQDADSFLAWMHRLEQLRETNNADRKLPYVWVIDQLEELFALGFTTEQQEAFSAALCYLAKAGHWVILCLRSDFFAQFQNQETLRSCVGDGIYTLGQPNDLSIDQMIQEPAWLAVCEYENDPNCVSLATILRKDLGNNMAALPLLSMCLKILYDKRNVKERLLTYKCYRDMDGIKGAINDKAEAIYNQLPKDAQDALPSVLKALTTIDDQHTGSIVARTAVLKNFPEGSGARKLIDAFSSKEVRLLILEADVDSKNPQLAASETKVRVSHESLLTNWKRAKNCIAADKELLPVRKRVETDMHLWEQSGQQPQMLLPAGLKLAEAEKLLVAWVDDLDILIQNYIRASLGAEQERQRQEQETRAELKRRLVEANHNFGLALLEKATQYRAQCRHNEVYVYVSHALNKLKPNLALEKILAKQLLSTAPIPSNIIQIGVHHANTVHALAYAPDGQTLASGSGDKTIKLWDVHSGALRHTLSGHKKGVNSVDFSPDGDILASGSDDNTIRLWDMASGVLRHTLSGHEYHVTSVAFSPDDQTLASGSCDNTIRLWDTASGVLRHILNGYEAWVNSVAFSPDGGILASGSYDNIIRLWDMASGELRHTLSSHESLINSVAFSPDGQTLASWSSSDNTIRLWDMASGTLHHTLSGDGETVTSVAFSPDGGTLASGSGGSTICLWDMANGALCHTLESDYVRVGSVVFSPDGGTLAIASDNAIRLWDVASDALRHIPSGHNSGVNQQRPERFLLKKSQLLI